ncbi:MAG: aminopeptidase N [Betaproteobacteria bacterium]|nr:aminopeptidase N [Betaproteobacteria bacterium]
MRTDQAPVISRLHYAKPAYAVDRVTLEFDLDPDRTRVKSHMQLRRLADAPGDAPLFLDGEDLTLQSLTVDGKAWVYATTDGGIRLDKLPGVFQLDIVTACSPRANTRLSGLYLSGDAFFTQCEAEGFRRITYWPDRPDVMSRFTVVLRADKAKYPVLLSNGNLKSQRPLDDGRMEAVWEDPFPKPSYLFALVAGRLVCREQRIRAADGREHLLQVYVREGDLDKTEHAMQSLVHSVAWDEQRFGLSLDLDRFMIVAVSDFNMGAMENKGLNIFNTKYVLANPATATDVDYMNIESVVGHEYFHNWTGNRITCRDWFQLSLKEGLTVFRDQEFTQDLAAQTGGESARAVKRIEDVRGLRAVQFPEDAGPMAHPVRPDSYVAIDNFYTPTVYEKGAEVVRMMQTLVGRAGFAAGMKLYFARHDGQAVTCDDFLAAMADANPGSALDMHRSQFGLWYSQAGTPRLRATGRYDATARSYTLSLTQACSATPGQPDKQAQIIPVRLGLLARGGEALSFHMETGARGTEALLVLNQPQQSFVLHEVDAEPIPSLLRGFSAPVLLDDGLSDADRQVLLAHDTDPFNRWEAAQRLALARLLPALQDGNLPLDAAYLDALRAVLHDTTLDPAFKELALTLPSEGYIAEQLSPIDPARIHQTRQTMRLVLTEQLRADWEQTWHALAPVSGYTPDFAGAGRRGLRNLALSYLCLTGDAVWQGRAYQLVKDADNMTDRFDALAALVGSRAELAAPALERFATQFAHEPLVMDKWFALQASAPGVEMRAIRALMQRPDFSIRNPNRARSVISTFCQGNPGAFHRLDGAGYGFWAEQVRTLDAINPQIAARLARALDRWRKLAPSYAQVVEPVMRELAAHPDLSADTREILGKALA